MTESVYATPKDAALARLADWAINDANRDPLVCEAKRAGATYDEITDITGLSSRTIASILKAAGLTGDTAKKPHVGGEQ